MSRKNTKALKDIQNLCRIQHLDENELCARAVSYTHLDVYKRQAEQFKAHQLRADIESLAHLEVIHVFVL